MPDEVDYTRSIFFAKRSCLEISIPDQLLVSVRKNLSSGLMLAKKSTCCWWLSLFFISMVAIPHTTSAGNIPGKTSVAPHPAVEKHKANEAVSSDYLSGLPTELLWNIANHLPPEGYCDLRTVNKRLHFALPLRPVLALVKKYYGTDREKLAIQRKLASSVYQRKSLRQHVPKALFHDPLSVAAFFRAGINQGVFIPQCVATLTGHTSWVCSVIALPSGQLVSWSADGKLKVWHLAQPDGSQCVVTLMHPGLRSAIALPSGQLLVSCSADNTLKVWDLAQPDDSQCVATLTGHTDRVLSVIALPGGQLVSCSFDMTLKVWDLAQQDGSQCVATLTGHTGWVCNVIALPSGQLVSCSADMTLKVWDLAQPDGSQCVATLTGHTGWIRCVIALPSGQLVSLSDDETLKVWLQPDGSPCVATLTGHTDWIRSVIALPSGQLVSCSHDKTLKVWDLAQPDGSQCVATLTGHTGWIRGVIALPSGQLVSWSDDETLKIWDLAQPDGSQCVATLTGHTGLIRSVIELPSGQLVSCSDDNTFKVWDLFYREN